MEGAFKREWAFIRENTVVKLKYKKSEVLKRTSVEEVLTDLVKNTLGSNIFAVF